MICLRSWRGEGHGTVQWVITMFLILIVQTRAGRFSFLPIVFPKQLQSRVNEISQLHCFCTETCKPRVSNLPRTRSTPWGLLLGWICRASSFGGRAREACMHTALALPATTDCHVCQGSELWLIMPPTYALSFW